MSARLSDAGAEDEPFDAPDDLAPLRQKCCDVLTSTDSIDKTNAMTLLQLFHDFESLVMSERHRRNHDVERMQHELSLLRLSSQHAESLADLSREVASLKAKLGSLDAHASSIDQLQRSVDALSTAAPRKR